MRIMLVSGLSINVKRVRLYNELAVSEVLRLRASAAKALGGRGLNLGVIGAPGLAFAAEAVSISLISSLISSAAENAALAQLEDANRNYEALIDNGTYLNISELSGLEIAEPSAWLGWRDRGRYIHNGDEFISIETDNGALMIRWRDVCAYHAPSPGEFLKKSEVRSMWAVLPAPSITPPKINYHGKLKFGRHPDGTISVRKDDQLIGFPTMEDFKKWAAQQTKE